MAERFQRGLQRAPNTPEQHRAKTARQGSKAGAKAAAPKKPGKGG